MSPNNGETRQHSRLKFCHRVFQIKGRNKNVIVTRMRRRVDSWWSVFQESKCTHFQREYIFLTSELEATEGPTEINEWCVKSVESTRAERSGEPPRWKDDSDEARVVKSRTHNEWGAAAAMRPTETEQQPEWVESLSSNIYSVLNYISLTRCSYLILLY